MELSWVKCGPAFCSLEIVLLDNVDAVGVYIIWHNTSGRVVYVGEGIVKDRIQDHRKDSRILAHRGDGILLVTWASIEDPDARYGVENYLTRLFSPAVQAARKGDVPEIAVNLPSA